MGRREYVSLAVEPLTNDGTDIYVNAIGTSIQYDLPKVPMIITAALNDMRSIMAGQYSRAKSNDYIFGLPESTFNTIPSKLNLMEDQIANELGLPKNSLVFSKETYAFAPTYDLSFGSYVKADLVGLRGSYLTTNDYDIAVAGGYSGGMLFQKYRTGDTSRPDYYYINEIDIVNQNYRYIKYVYESSTEEVFDYYVDAVDDVPGYAVYKTETSYAYVAYHTAVDLKIPFNSGSEYIIVQFSLVNEPALLRYAIFTDKLNPEMVNTAVEYGDYYPILPIKQDFKYWDDDSHGEAYKKHISQTYKKYKIGTLERLTDSFKEIKPAPKEEGEEEKEEEDNIDDIFLFHGSNIYSKEVADNKYIYVFFLNMLNNLELVYEPNPDVYVRSNQIHIKEQQYDYTLMFRNVDYEVIDSSSLDPNDNNKVTYSHVWEDFRPKANNYTYNELDDEEVEVVEFVENEHSSWSNNVYTVSKLVDGSIRSSVSIQGIQTVHRIRIAPSGNIKIVDDIPSGKLEEDYYTYSDLTDAQKVVTELIQPPITLIPLDQTILNLVQEGNLSNKEKRILLKKSFHFMIYGSKTVYIHWTREVRAFVIEIIILSITLYSIATLGINIGSAIARDAFVRFAYEQGKRYLINAAVKWALDEIFGEELGGLLHAIGAIGISVSRGLNNSNFSVMDNVTDISFGVLKGLVEIGAYKLRKEIAELEAELKEDRDRINALAEEDKDKEEVDVFLLETPEEFLMRTTNGYINKLVDLHLTSDDLVKVTTGVQLISPNVEFEDIELGVR